VSVNHLSQELSSHTHGVPAYVIQRIVLLADENGDNYITYPEFLRLVSYFVNHVFHFIFFLIH